jgi:hypothetical protein
LACLLLLALPWLVPPKTAHAYLDPGTGSILLQVLIGGVAGLGVIVKLYWHRLRSLFGVRKKDPREIPKHQITSQTLISSIS